MDQRVKLVVGGAIVLLVLVTLATIYLVTQAKKSEVGSEGINGLDSLSTISLTPTPDTPKEGGADGSTKLYQEASFSLRYPNSWGILSCSNSAHFEFDPYSTTDTKIVCDRSVRPITVLVAQNLNCRGELVTLGSHQVLKTKTADRSGDLDYHWCLSVGGNTGLDITHRVSQVGSPASSKVDYSSQIEELIKTITVTPRGS